MNPGLEALARSGSSGVLACLAFACSSGLENPSAFSEERFLCAPALASEWQAERERCRAAFELDRSCKGALSFVGELQGSAVVVDAPLDEAEFLDDALADGSWRRDQIRFEASSPYFIARFRFTSLGGGVFEAGEARDLDLRPASANEPSDNVEDSLAHGSLSLSASGQNVQSPAGAGGLLISSQSLIEQTVSFEMELEDGAIEGCFYAFTTSRLLRPFESNAE